MGARKLMADMGMNKDCAMMAKPSDPAAAAPHQH